MSPYRNIILSLVTLFWLMILASCSVNPFRSDNELTGSAAGTAIGAAAVGGTAYIAGASKAEIGLAAIVGAAAGYYVTSLPFSAGGITHVGGKVYTLGDFVTIEIQSDYLFDVNTSDLLTEAAPILDSVVSVLQRNPNNNIMISGNTNGYYTDRYERALSENRARQVAAYLWAHGINNFTDRNSNYASVNEKTQTFSRRLRYTGYGSYFPISTTLTAEGRRQNNRIQITSYPKKSKLNLNKCGKVFSNIGDIKEPELENAQIQAELNESFKGDTLPENNPVRGDEFKNENQVSSENPTTPRGYSPDESDLRAERWETYSNATAAPASIPPSTTPPVVRRYKGE